MLNRVKRKHNRNKNDAAMSDLISKIAYKCGWYGCDFHKINQYAPTTKRCWHRNSDGKICGYTWDTSIPTKIRKLKCPVCGADLDRDINAAQGILITAHMERGDIDYVFAN